MRSLLLMAACLPLVLSAQQVVSGRARDNAHDIASAQIEALAQVEQQDALPNSPHPESAKEDSRAELLDRVFNQLESPAYHDRQRAKQDLRKLSELDDFRALILERIAERLGSTETSSEVRTMLMRTWREAGSVASLPTRAVTDAELDTAIFQLSDERYAVRAAAEFRLDAACRLAEDPVALLLRMKRASAEAKDVHSRAVLFALHQDLRLQWIASEPGSWKFPPIAPGTIEQQVDLLATDPATAGSNTLYAQTEQDLIDALLRPEYFETVRDQLQQKFEDKNLTTAGQARLDRVFALTKHTVVFEGWTSRETTEVIEQVEVAGPPTLEDIRKLFGNPNPITATIVSDADDERVIVRQCTYMAPGEYPIGQSFLNVVPGRPIFQIVNLATPRSHLLYQIELAELSFEQRVRRVSQRTLDNFVARRQRLSPAEQVMLRVLDPAAVSREAVKLLSLVEDHRSAQPAKFAQAGSRASHHHEICYALAHRGRAEAAEGIIAALEANAFLGPVEDDDPFDWPRVALFSIASRDPWPTAKDWLNDQLESDVKLRLGDSDERAWDSPQPSVRAAAAWILLRNAGIDPATEEFELEKVRFRVLDDAGCPSYHFRTEAGFQRTLSWLQQHQSEANSLAPIQATADSKAGVH